MPHLHLPADHSDADLMLAANLADIVGSEDLYVAWTHDTGAGAVPTIAAALRDQRPLSLAGLLGQMLSGVRAVWDSVFRVSVPVVPTGAPAATPRAGEPSA